MNWTQLGREFNVPAANKGQVVKKYAKACGIDVLQLDCHPPNSRLRARKLRMQDVSIPTHRTVEGIKEDWHTMIEKGELSLGEP